MLLLALLAAMMLVVTAPAVATQQGGSKYPSNWYPNGYWKYCSSDSSSYKGDAWASKWCDQWYSGKVQKKQWNGKWYWYVHVYYKWKWNGKWQNWDDWYYCQYKKYDDPNSVHPYYKAWVGYQPSGQHYWESFYWGGP